MIPPAEIIALEDHFGSGLEPKQPFVLVRGSGARLWDAHGREYIDCGGGPAIASVDHANPVVAEAIAEQAQCLLVCPRHLPANTTTWSQIYSAWPRLLQGACPGGRCSLDPD